MKAGEKGEEGGTVDNTLVHMRTDTQDWSGPDTKQVFNQLLWINREIDGQSMNDGDQRLGAPSPSNSGKEVRDPQLCKER